MGGGRVPPLKDIVECVSVDSHSASFKGTNANDGSSVTLSRVGETGYFKEGEKFTITYEPVKKDD